MNLAAAALRRFGRCIGKPPGYERVVRVLVPPARIRRATEIKLRVDGVTIVTRPAVPLEHNEEYVARGSGSEIDTHDYFAGIGYSLFALGRHSPQPIHRGARPRNANVRTSPGGRTDG